MTALTLAQEPRPMIVGERLNTQGSRRVKRLILADDYDGLVDVAREQVAGGAHCLDICTALTEREGEDEAMAMLVKRLEMSVEAPLMIDSTEAKVIQRALETNPGRAIVNSVNLENGRKRIDDVLPLAMEHGAAVVALTIEKSIGMAKSVADKVKVASQIEAICCHEYGLPRGRLIFDVLTFTLATGEAEFLEAGINTIEGIRAVKAALPGVLTVLGVSNISFGLNPAARAVVNSVFLFHCVEAGLDLAIVNPKDITPYPLIMPDERELAEELIFNRRPDALARVIARYEGAKHTTETKAEEEDDSALPVNERIHRRILHRKKEGIEALLDEALKTQTPVALLNGCLLGAMKDVGDRFGAGELILPFVLQSAEVMKKAVSYLEQFLEKDDALSKGVVVLATVFGDVHDIGKNLVHTILANNGYTVHDLGKQVPLHTIIEKATEVRADAIGLSALLVSTSKQMPLCLQELHRAGLRFPVLVGGAAINRAYVSRIGFVDGDTYYDPGVFYAKDAFEGLAIMDRLRVPAERERLRMETEADARASVARRAARAAASGDRTGVRRSDVARNMPIPKAPFWGAREMRNIRLADVFRCLDLRSLYRLQWGAKSAKGDQWRRLLNDDFRPRLDRMRSEAIETGWLTPRALYGYFPAAADGDELVVFRPNDATEELARFAFPRQPDAPYLCISDYFAPIDAERRDVVGFQAVTVGPLASERYTRLQERGEFAEALFVHGLAVESAEACAEYVHRRMRREFGIIPGQGKRYSWGYPACPNVEDHAIFFGFMPCETIGLEMTEGFALVPEQSTVALVVHHPEATYFSALGAGVTVGAL